MKTIMTKVFKSLFFSLFPCRLQAWVASCWHGAIATLQLQPRGLELAAPQTAEPGLQALTPCGIVCVADLQRHVTSVEPPGISVFRPES